MALAPMQEAPPRLHCGLCGGGVRLYRGVLHGRPISDWKHTDAPPGTSPHRPVLGTPVDRETLDRIHRAPEPEVVKKAPAPKIVNQRDAAPELYEYAQSINSVLKLAEVHGWHQPRPMQHLKRDDGVEYLRLKLRRRDLGAVVIWRLRGESWQFEDGWTLSIAGARQVQSTSLKKWLQTRDEECPDCGRSSITHPEGDCP